MEKIKVSIWCATSGTPCSCTSRRELFAPRKREDCNFPFKTQKFWAKSKILLQDHDSGNRRKNLGKKFFPQKVLYGTAMVADLDARRLYLSQGWRTFFIGRSKNDHFIKINIKWAIGKNQRWTFFFFFKSAVQLAQCVFEII